MISIDQKMRRKEEIIVVSPQDTLIDINCRITYQYEIPLHSGPKAMTVMVKCFTSSGKAGHSGHLFCLCNPRSGGRSWSRSCEIRIRHSLKLCVNGTFDYHDHVWQLSLVRSFAQKNMSRGPPEFGEKEQPNWRQKNTTTELFPITIEMRLTKEWSLWHGLLFSAHLNNNQQPSIHHSFPLSDWRVTTIVNSFME